MLFLPNVQGSIRSDLYRLTAQAAMPLRYVRTNRDKSDDTTKPAREWFCHFLLGPYISPVV